MELSSLIGKRILSPVGEVLGFCLRACPTRDLKKLSSLVCVDGEEEEYYLPARSITAISDAIIAGKARLGSPTGISFPVGMPAYSEHGELIGVVADFLLGEAPSVVISKIIITNDGARAVYPAECVQIGETVIVYSAPVKRLSSKKRRKPAQKKKTAPAQDAPAPAPAPLQLSLPEPIVAEQPAPAPEPAPSRPPETERPAPAPAISAEPAENQSAVGIYSINRLNLLGRRVKKSVFDRGGEPIVRAGERITADILSAARKENKLLQLTVNTLTNLV